MYLRYKVLAVVIVFCGLSTAVDGQYYYGQIEPYYPPIVAQPEPYYPPTYQQDYEYPPSQYRSLQSSDLSRKCALASEYIKHNNCGPQGCDIGYCVALQNGCRINGWGHVCNWKNRN